MSADRAPVLIVGAGGREHAIGWAFARHPDCPPLVFAPGNPGTAELGENVLVAADDLEGLVELAARRQPRLVVVGPEVPLVAGLVDRLQDAGIRAVGPTAAAARIEGSKAWAKEFMGRHGIPTAASTAFAATDREDALRYVNGHTLPVVLKADGLAAGKGVIVANTRGEATEALEELLGGSLGEAAGHLVVEEFMEGEEASVFALCDGRDYVLLPPAQDHKRIGDGDTGPNTGGMGAYAPAPVVDSALMAQVEERIIRPVLAGMAAEGHPYIGVLYVGLMIGRDGPRVVEFNCRLGDPETQAVLPLLDCDLLDLFERASAGGLSGADAPTTHDVAACVMLAAPGYPSRAETGSLIHGIRDVPSDVLVFHSGTRVDEDGNLVTAGGRVLGVVGRGATLAAALERAYAGAAAVRFDGMQMRRDIGRRGLAARAT